MRLISHSHYHYYFDNSQHKLNCVSIYKISIRILILVAGDFHYHCSTFAHQFTKSSCWSASELASFIANTTSYYYCYTWLDLLLLMLYLDPTAAAILGPYYYYYYTWTLHKFHYQNHILLLLLGPHYYCYTWTTHTANIKGALATSNDFHSSMNSKPVH